MRARPEARPDRRAANLRDTNLAHIATLRYIVRWEVAGMAGPGDEMLTGAVGQHRLRASYAGREQVIAALKDAFVQGRLAKDEFDLRVSKALASYAELDTLTADIPAALTEIQSAEVPRQSHNKKVIQRGTAAGASVSMAFTATLVTVYGSPNVAYVAVPLVGLFMTVLLAGLLTLLSWVLEKGSARQVPQAPPTSTAGQESGRLAPPDAADRLRQIRHHPGHTAEARRSRLLHPQLT